MPSRTTAPANHPYLPGLEPGQTLLPKIEQTLVVLLAQKLTVDRKTARQYPSQLFREITHARDAKQAEVKIENVSPNVASIEPVKTAQNIRELAERYAHTVVVCDGGWAYRQVLKVLAEDVKQGRMKVLCVLANSDDTSSFENFRYNELGALAEFSPLLPGRVAGKGRGTANSPVVTVIKNML